MYLVRITNFINFDFSSTKKMNEKFADFFHVNSNNPATTSDKSTKSEFHNYKEAAIREQVVNWKFNIK